MSMFQKNAADTPTTDSDTVIAALVKVEGDLSSQGNIIIDGEVHGSVKTEHHLKVGGGAKIYADVKADTAYIAGEVHGNIHIKDSLELTATAKVVGDVQTNTIVIAQGGVLHGKCVMISDQQVKELRQANKRTDVNTGTVDEAA